MGLKSWLTRIETQKLNYAILRNQPREGINRDGFLRRKNTFTDEPSHLWQLDLDGSNPDGLPHEDSIQNVLTVGRSLLPFLTTDTEAVAQLSNKAGLPQYATRMSARIWIYLENAITATEAKRLFKKWAGTGWGQVDPSVFNNVSVHYCSLPSLWESRDNKLYEIDRKKLLGQTIGYVKGKPVDPEDVSVTYPPPLSFEIFFLNKFKYFPDDAT